MDLGRLDEALACFDAILERTSRYPLAHYNRACVLARLGKVGETVKELSLAAAEDRQFLEDALDDPDFERIRQTTAFRRLFGGKKAFR
jgi:tetratricopeptide (TPR) repeat protein